MAQAQKTEQEMADIAFLLEFSQQTQRLDPQADMEALHKLSDIVSNLSESNDDKWNLELSVARCARTFAKILCLKADRYEKLIEEKDF